MAVMYFENLVDPDDPQRLGDVITNLLITDMSESKHFDVVSSQRLYDILSQLGHEGVTKIDQTIATRVAEHANANLMLLVDPSSERYKHSTEKTPIRDALQRHTLGNAPSTLQRLGC